MIHKSVTIIFLSALVYSNLTLAGGPLILEGPYGHTAVTYQNPNITLHIESGDLGTRTNEATNIIVEDALNLWNNVNTSTINLKTEALNDDINFNNFDQYLPSPDDAFFNADDNLNPIIYDSDGKIIEAFFGNQSEFIAGFAASFFTNNGSYFQEGYAVINGNTKEPLSDTELKLLITHEIGHFFGLDHSQTNINNQETNSGFPQVCSTTSKSNYPVMYPFICRDGELHSDDISAVSALYPSANINNNYGILHGHFVNNSGSPILGANIWAENIVSGETYSIVSDYLRQGTGYYKLLLPAGTYTLHANSINTLFYSGSGVGPYAETTTDASFTAPHPITPQVNYLGINESNEEIINIATNQSLIINFSSAGKFVIFPEKNNDDDDNSLADIFGATSLQTTLLIIFSVAAGRRLNSRL
ncbi:MAG: hypothetical protein GQ573_09035 [Gammaproteobacteria bacterium]|nr:hypothetical protein [Gammaproteobacteria bacterium]